MQFGVCAAKFITHAKNINNELGNFQALTHRIFAVNYGILGNLVDKSFLVSDINYSTY